MKYVNFLAVVLFIATGVHAQETVVELSNKPGYSEDVYFKFSSEHAENVPVDSWEIAFLRTGSFDFAERINDGLGIKVYEVSLNPDDWNTVTPANITGSTPIYYNSDTEWEFGAFDQGSDPSNPFRFGWGVYNPATHHVEGITVFILEYPDGGYKKFMIEDFFNGYTFKYATWNSSTSSWSADTQVVLPNSNNPGKLFNYYNLSTQEEVIASPNLEDWDLVFQKYVTDLGGTFYPVQGALQNPDVLVAVSDNPNATGSELEFKEEINTIGYDWKTFDGQGYVVDTDTYYFLKHPDGTVYRLHFLTFEGASTGNFSFGFENVTTQMGTEDFSVLETIKIYPNPTVGRQITVSIPTNTTDSMTLEIYSVTGQKVGEKQIAGTEKHTLDLHHLNSGIYFMQFKTNSASLTKKLILN